MDKLIALCVTNLDQNDIHELSFAELLLVGAAGGIEEFPVIPR